MITVRARTSPTSSRTRTAQRRPCATAATRAGPLDGQVPHLARRTERATDQLSADDEPAPDPGAQTQVREIGAVNGVRFGECRETPIVGDHHGAAAARVNSAVSGTPTQDGRLGQATTVPVWSRAGAAATPTRIVPQPASWRARVTRSRSRATSAGTGPSGHATVTSQLCCRCTGRTATLVAADIDGKPGER